MIALSYIFILLAAALNSIMDSVENEHINDTVFFKLDSSFWSKRASWTTNKKLFGYKFDAWHLAKSGMIIFITLEIVFYKPCFGWLDFILFGAEWNLFFNLFYNKVFKK